MSHGGKDLSRGTECIANYDFKGANIKDLPFKKGDILIILNPTNDPNWFEAKRLSDGRKGTIPANYVQKRGAMNLHQMPWFFGKITREQAEELLRPREPGLFLMRESTNYPGDYTLCVCSPPGKVEHYRILTRNSMLTVDEEEFFDSLTKLVEHYMKDADGLCTRLKTPLKKRKDMEIATTAFMETFKKEGWVVKWSDINLKEKIGAGEFGEVYKGEYRGQIVAVKQLKDDSKAAQAFLSEASVMTTLRHPNLVELLGICFQNKGLYILTEFCALNSLVEYLRSRGRAVITLDQQLGFARDVCAGMLYLEEQHIVHRDLAARNVLLSETTTAKVADFGLARDMQQELESGKFPVKWTAPEAIKNNNFSTKSDVWSFGILLWEIFSFGRNPYPRVPLKDVLDKVIKGYRMEVPDGCPNGIYSIMLRCWNIDPDARPSFAELWKELDTPPRETSL